MSTEINTLNDRYARRYGSRYEEVKDKSIKDIAAIIRAEIKTLVKNGEVPRHWKYSVRVERGTCIRITVEVPKFITDLEMQFIEEEGRCFHNVAEFEHNREFIDSKFNPLYDKMHVQTLLRKLESSFNYDGSDAMTDYFDVNFYCSIDFYGTL